MMRGAGVQTDNEEFRSVVFLYWNRGWIPVSLQEFSCLNIKDRNNNSFID